ncbi:MAG TPA: hypothetical protein VHH36_02310, partial [Candidatus Thermoplasmatota archaeon]|nr:hypothetical protein [Candidatus Thermoplasmatota archaeon]
MKTRHVVLIAFLLAAVVAAPALGKGPGDHAERSQRMAHDMDEQDFNNLSANARERGLARAEAAKHFARWSYADGNASGRFVSFRLDEETGNLTSFTVVTGNGSTTFFAAVTPDAFEGNGSAKAHGAVLHLDADEGGFSAHNNPTAHFAYTETGAGMNVTFLLAGGANATVNGTQATVVAGNLHGHVLVTGNATLTLSADNRTLVAALTEGDKAVFLGHPADAPGATANLHALKDAIAKGRVGAVTTIVDADGAPLEDRASFGVLARAKSVGKGHANLTVESDEPRGRAVVVNLDSSIVDPADDGKVNVTLDGRPVPRAANVTQVLDAQGTSASVFVNRTANGVQVVVYVPGFSAHDLAIST